MSCSLLSSLCSQEELCEDVLQFALSLRFILDLRLNQMPNHLQHSKGYQGHIAANSGEYDCTPTCANSAVLNSMKCTSSSLFRVIKGVSKGD